MLHTFSFFIGLRYTLSRQRSRSVAFISRVAMIGIVLGVSLLILVLSVMNGFDKELRESILRIMPQVTIYHRQGIAQWPSLRQQILQQDNVEEASPFVELKGMLNSNRKTEPVLIYGVHKDLESTTSIIDQFLEEGMLSQLSEDTSGIAIGYDIATKLGVAKGDVVSLIIPKVESGSNSRTAQVRRLTVLDILHSKTEVDSSLAIMGLDAAAKLLPQPELVSGLHIKVDDLFLAPAISRSLDGQLPFEFFVTDWTRTHGNIYAAIKMSKSLIGLLLLLIIAIAAFNVVSTLVMVVIDKQSDIAILKTLGSSRRQILSIFMIQGSVISILGTFIGVILGLLLSVFVQDFVELIENFFGINFLKSDIYPVSYLPSEILIQDVLFVATISLLMSFLATVYPAWKATKVIPAESLRYD